MDASGVTVEVSIVDDALFGAVVRKVATWEKLCRCHDEFGGDAARACGELAGVDDQAMIELRDALNATVKRVAGVPLPRPEDPYDEAYFEAINSEHP